MSGLGGFLWDGMSEWDGRSEICAKVYHPYPRSVLPNGHTPMYLHAIILKAGGMDRQASDLFRVMYSLDHHRFTSASFYEDLYTSLKNVFMDDEANQVMDDEANPVMNDMHAGTTQRNLADEFDDADDRVRLRIEYDDEDDDHM